MRSSAGSECAWLETRSPHHLFLVDHSPWPRGHDGPSPARGSGHAIVYLSCRVVMAQITGVSLLASATAATIFGLRFALIKRHANCYYRQCRNSLEMIDHSYQPFNADEKEKPYPATRSGVPKKIHQLWHDKNNIPLEIRSNMSNLLESNPGWSHIIYDHNDIDDYVLQHYGPEMKKAINSFNPKYAICKADLFRYLVVFKEGGVYLDAKSSLVGKFDDLIRPDDAFLLSQWGSIRDPAYQGYGFWRELRHIPGGEFHQWYLISVAAHPFLGSVISLVLSNIYNYNPWRIGVGQRGVLNLTGPIAFSKAIYPIKDLHPHRIIDVDRVGLKYSIFESGIHKSFYKDHYTNLTTPIIKTSLAAELTFGVYLKLRNCALSLKRFTS